MFDKNKHSQSFVRKENIFNVGNNMGIKVHCDRCDKIFETNTHPFFESYLKLTGKKYLCDECIDYYHSWFMLNPDFSNIDSTEDLEIVILRKIKKCLKLLNPMVLFQKKY